MNPPAPPREDRLAHAPGEMAGRVRALDWSATPLGPRAAWPQALHAAVELILASPLAMIVLWGPEHVQIYNDGYRALMGDKHPAGLGQRVRECWPEAWEFNRAVCEAAWRGESLSFRDQPLVLERRGRPEDTWFDLTYAPLRDEEGAVAGVLATVVETTAKVRGEAALREGEALLRGMFEQAPTFMVLLQGPEHRVARANPGYLRVIGGRDVLGRTIAEALPEAAEQGFIALLDRVYRTGEAYSALGARWALREAPGAAPREMFLDFVFQPIRDAAGQVVGIFVEGADVTERVRAAAALRESEALGRQILDGATDYAIIATDLDGRVTRWNAGAARILGWSEAEMRGRTLHPIFTPEDVAAGRVEAERRAALATGRAAGESAQRRRTGEHFPASCALTPLRDDAGAPVGFVKVLRDRTSAQRREARLAFIARASAGLLEAADPDAVLPPLLEEGAGLLGYDQAYLYSVAAEEGNLLLTHAFGVGERARRALACVPFSVPLCGIVAETGRPLVLDNLLSSTDPRLAAGRAAGLDAYAGYPVFADGRVVAVVAFGIRACPAFAAEELEVMATLARFLSVVRERREREAALERRVAERTAELREREEQLRQAQKMEAIGQLTGGLAHDVNNMLQGIGGAVEMLERRVAEGRLAELPRLFAAARDGVARAASLTHGLLAFARRGRLDARPLALDEAVGGMADLIRRTVGPEIELRLRLCGGAWAALLDRGGLESALLNLAINARDAMPAGGVLAFATRELALSAHDLAGEPDPVAPGEFVEVAVSDTGEGMTPDVLARVFEPFFTTKPIGKGTGLGLSQIYGFVRQSGGMVRIASTPGEGTTVRLFFPRAAAEAALPAPAPAIAPRAAGEGEESRTLLLVEDEGAVRALTAETLRERGYEVLEAPDGPAALRLLAGARRVDLLVTDVGLPGLNGRQLADAARERRPGLPVLFITGYAGVALDGGLPPGMAAITKPFTHAALTERVAAMLEGVEAF